MRLNYENPKCFLGSFQKFLEQLYSKKILANVAKQIHEDEFYANNIPEYTRETTSDFIFLFSWDISVSWYLSLQTKIPLFQLPLPFRNAYLLNMVIIYMWKAKQGNTMSLRVLPWLYINIFFNMWSIFTSNLQKIFWKIIHSWSR